MSSEGPEEPREGPEDSDTETAPDAAAVGRASPASGPKSRTASDRTVPDSAEVSSAETAVTEHATIPRTA